MGQNHSAPLRVPCEGTGKVVPPHILPRGPWPRAGRCPVCQQVYRRNPNTGAMSAHTVRVAQSPAPRERCLSEC